MRSLLGALLLCGLTLPAFAAEPSALIGERRARAEWAKAENRQDCAPLALAASGEPEGAPRAAAFGGGWGVAFDLPELRSAYGFAGTGLLPDDDADAAVQRDRLYRQWPYFRDLAQFPAPSFAGYGQEGAEPYPAGNPEGAGLQSLAYVRIAGQRCTYNVWSRISRAHLEWMLGTLRIAAD
ncbi:hypothetical protein FHS51_001127 [Sphingobium wenxiniae]|uniref:Uncharacterized protein n=1 Tax=Sphingobium wenxiniae (strain DSM 21828 / CGMCC 1.7748 / JZ-1) TaxID=595605 RepID=A0A562KEF7_SPHWJ|nr:MULTISPECIES: hypothetical protein [Sphingobium]MBB6190907.1 hypothetical protein [Sphingobium wenxiniae]TWH93786.1 hypothetical protein IQ35_01995 [Sphingobium wenxiniae]WRD75681.1 hypothetical protein QQ987_12870 [Sphingobium baderi]